MAGPNHYVRLSYSARKTCSEATRNPAPARILSYRPPDSGQTNPSPADPVAPAASASQGPLFHCTVKGCVYPPAPESRGKCFYHWLQEQDPQLFASLQPSCLLLEQARFGLPDIEPDDSRVVDRTRQLLERAAFQLDDAA